jgi:hypothetical protein
MTCKQLEEDYNFCIHEKTLIGFEEYAANYLDLPYECQKVVVTLNAEFLCVPSYVWASF